MQISYFVSTDKRNLVNGVCIWIFKRDSQKKSLDSSNTFRINGMSNQSCFFSVCKMLIKQFWLC